MRVPQDSIRPAAFFSKYVFYEAEAQKKFGNGGIEPHISVVDKIVLCVFDDYLITQAIIKVQFIRGIKIDAVNKPRKSDCIPGMFEIKELDV